MALTPDALAQVPLFAPLKEKERAKLSKRFLPRSFAAGDEIVSEGNTGTGFSAITAGGPRICWALAQELARRVREARLEY